VTPFSHSRVAAPSLDGGEHDARLVAAMATASHTSARRCATHSDAHGFC
jgi:hypothetical protein